VNRIGKTTAEASSQYPSHLVFPDTDWGWTC